MRATGVMATGERTAPGVGAPDAEAWPAGVAVRSTAGARETWGVESARGAAAGAAEGALGAISSSSSSSSSEEDARSSCDGGAKRRSRGRAGSRVRSVKICARAPSPGESTRVSHVASKSRQNEMREIVRTSYAYTAQMHNRSTSSHLNRRAVGRVRRKAGREFRSAASVARAFALSEGLCREFLLHQK